MPPAWAECGAPAAVTEAPSGVAEPPKNADYGHLQSREDAEAMLRMLVALFPEPNKTRAAHGDDVSSRFAWLRPEDVPASASLCRLSFQKSLVHEEHLTKILQDELDGECESSQ
jgi:hypothetical protein